MWWVSSRRSLLAFDKGREQVLIALPLPSDLESTVPGVQDLLGKLEGFIVNDPHYFNLTINEEEAAVIRQIYHWYTQEGYGSAKIANMLNERGLKTPRPL